MYDFWAQWCHWFRKKKYLLLYILYWFYDIMYLHVIWLLCALYCNLAMNANISSCYFLMIYYIYVLTDHFTWLLDLIRAFVFVLQMWRSFVPVLAWYRIFLPHLNPDSVCVFVLTRQKQYVHWIYNWIGAETWKSPF